MTNPSLEKAATLKYKGRKTPIMSAFGENDLAKEMLALAKEHNVPIFEDADLVNLLSQMDIGRAIPPELYEWIASVLAFAYFARNEVPEGFSQTETKTAYKKIRDAYLDDN